jgi:hypothetical protein
VNLNKSVKNIRTFLVKIKWLENLKTCDCSVIKSNNLACSIFSVIGKLGDLRTEVSK